MEEKVHDEASCAKKTKNLISVIILLAGLFVGSLFVDVVQAVKGNGYSQKNLNKSEIFEADGKTWVAYNDPAVPVSIVNDATCQKCDVSDAVVWLKRVLPTVSMRQVAYDSAEGKNLIDEFGIKSLPAFIFDKSLDQTDFYTQAATIFDNQNGQYVLKTQELGLPAGKYLSLPQINASDATFGKTDASVKLVVFSDFQCPYCKLFYQTVRDAMKQYGDKILFAYKELPLDIHPQAANAALAAECAKEQGKFWEYGDLLYKNQSTWGAAKDATSTFKGYAVQLGLNASQFNQCLDSKKYQSVIDEDKKEADSFGISGTPAVFVGDQFETGAVTADQLKADIESQLNPGQSNNQNQNNQSPSNQSPSNQNSQSPDSSANQSPAPSNQPGQ